MSSGYIYPILALCCAIAAGAAALICAEALPENTK